MAVVLLAISAMALIFGMAMALVNGINIVAVISLCIGLVVVVLALREVMKSWREDH
jgi:hypothetical protein